MTTAIFDADLEKNNSISNSNRAMFELGARGKAFEHKACLHVMHCKAV